MAILHVASLTPRKPELVQTWLPTREWNAGTGDLDVVGSYRLDDPEGVVGIEGMLLARGEVVLHVVLTYRGAPLDGAEAALVGRTHHSVLGPRWVYDAVGDPVGAAALIRAARGEQVQAVLDVWDGDVLVERREPSVRITHIDQVVATASGAVSAVEVGGVRLEVLRVVGAKPSGDQALLATWSGGSAVVVGTRPVAVP
jgi:hypothetical protein